MYKNSTIATDLSSGRKTLISGDLMACDRFLIYALGRILQSLSEGSYSHVLTCKGRKVGRYGKIVQMRKFHFRRGKYINILCTHTYVNVLYILYTSAHTQTYKKKGIVCQTHWAAITLTKVRKDVTVNTHKKKIQNA